MSQRAPQSDPRQSNLLKYRLQRFRLRVYRFVRRTIAARLGLPLGLTTNAGFSKVQIEADIIVYFGDDVARIYQMEQWMPVFETLNTRHKVLIVARNERSFSALQFVALPVVYLRRLRELNELFQANSFKVALYVNNSALNFHSLMFPDLLHVHLNHGESDKISMASNQAKAYDRVFVAGQAAIDRYNANLLEFDGRNLVTVGRPQLDVDYGRTLTPSTRPTILYAPTWAGERDEMNYSSVDTYGLTIVNQLLATREYRVVYKPHPRVPDLDSRTATAHEAIVAAVERAATSDPDGGHVVEMTAPILSLFADCDAMISDVSSVGLDWLYLATGKPLLLTDRYNNYERLQAQAPIAAGSYVIDASNVNDCVRIAREALESDLKREEREQMRRYYFGDIAAGDSTARFLSEIEAVLEARDKAVAAKRALIAPQSDSGSMVAAG